MKKILLFTFLLLCTLPVSSKKAGEFTVLQWNIWQEGTSVPGGYEAIINEIVRLKPDFVTFSEVRNIRIATSVPESCLHCVKKACLITLFTATTVAY